MKRQIIVLLFVIAMLPALLFAGGSVVPVGTYLYATEDKLPDKAGKLIVNFSTPGPKRLVVAYGRKYRKDRSSRAGTTEDERELFKPRLAKLSNNGKTATFTKLAADYYDIAVINTDDMTVYEGISLWQENDANPPANSEAYQEEIRKSLGLRDDRIGGWEGFFDTKVINRIEFCDGCAGVFMQQLRKGVALAESGEKLQGCIHSIDVVWVERAAGDNGWQVIDRQQLYRDEISSRDFFKHTHMPALNGIRIGTKAKTLDLDF